MERREPLASAPATDTEAARRALPDTVPFSADERRILRDALMHSKPLDEAYRATLVEAVEAVRKTMAELVKHETTWQSVSKLALTSLAFGEVADPTLTRITPDPLDKIWRQVGGYLGESIDKVRSGAADE